MYQEKKIVVVIPAYNVENHIEGVIKTIPSFIDEIIVVEDASTDDTREVLLALQDSRVTVVHHSVNQGVGGAMVSGFKRALECGAEVIVKMDGDGQMDPSQLAILLDTIVVGGYDYAKGNRFLDGDQLISMPKARLIGNFGLTFLTKLASGYWNVFDPQNGYVAARADVLRKLPLDRLARRYFFENDMLIHMNIFGARVKDIPIPARYRDERSSMRLTQVVVTFPIHLFKRFWYRIYQKYVLRNFSPVALFWTVGTLLLTWGIGFGAYRWIKSSWTGQSATTGTVMLSVLPLMLGFQLALQAILIEIQESSR